MRLSEVLTVRKWLITSITSFIHDDNSWKINFLSWKESSAEISKPEDSWFRWKKSLAKWLYITFTNPYNFSALRFSNRALFWKFQAGFQRSFWSIPSNAAGIVLVVSQNIFWISNRIFVVICYISLARLVPISICQRLLINIIIFPIGPYSLGWNFPLKRFCNLTIASNLFSISCSNEFGKFGKFDYF